MPFKDSPDYLKDILINNKFSPSEKHGIGLLTPKDIKIYSPGVSTGGVAEIKMALENPKRMIIASTIDAKGIAEVQQTVIAMGLKDQIQVKNEDVSKHLNYRDNNFDYVYARLVLHYLPKDALDSSLRQLNRILKPNGKIFIVVRSIDDPDRMIPNATYDENTCLTTYPWMDEGGHVHPEKLVSRYFHSIDSISTHLQNADFKMKDISQYDEKLYLDFSRKQLSSQVANVIEIVAMKE